MRFFHPKSLLPLEQILQEVGEVEAVLYRYLRDKSLQITEEEFRLFPLIDTGLHRSQALSAHVQMCLRQRADGEPEGSAKWHDQEVFNYHYPG